MCQHQPACPDFNSTDCAAARSVTQHHEQGWSLLCNGVVLLCDTGVICPDGRIVPPHRLGNCKSTPRRAVSASRQHPTSADA
ncbi:DUF5999 family protein [Streptomyces decoyicus]|uniref:DUF5999 family protein n=1 Tax=Streptomyces decoyicus TaxID=249567 RepID=UPI0033BBEE81